MITIIQADEVHTVRGNTEWTNLSSTEKTAALAKADDYITAHYLPFKADVEADNQRLVIATALLALEIQTNPVALKADPAIKSEEIESDGDSIKTTYQDADKAPYTDPYPLVTALLAPLRVAASTGASISFGRMVL